MRQYFAYGSVQGAAGNRVPYRDPRRMPPRGGQRSLRFSWGASLDRESRRKAILRSTTVADLRVLIEASTLMERVRAAMFRSTFDPDQLAWSSRFFPLSAPPRILFP